MRYYTGRTLVEVSGKFEYDASGEFCLDSLAVMMLSLSDGDKTVSCHLVGVCLLCCHQLAVLVILAVVLLMSVVFQIVVLWMGQWALAMVLPVDLA